MIRTALLVLLVAAAAGCPAPAPYRCSVAADCGLGTVCDPSGTCVAEPGTDAPALDGPALDGPPADARPPDYALCVPGIELTGDDPCAAMVCAGEASCCQVSWDEQCVRTAEVLCRLPCSQVLAAAGYTRAEAGVLSPGDLLFDSRFQTTSFGWLLGVAWGDADSDQRPELAVGREATGGLEGVGIFRGGGLGAENRLILTPEDIGGAPITTMDTVEWRDFDNDDDLDLLASGRGVFLIENTPAGYVAHELTTEDAHAMWADDDGAAPWDLVIIRHGTNQPGDERLVHHRLSAPPYALDAVTAGNTLSTFGFNDLVWCDVSGDHKRDVIAAGFGPAFKFVATTTSWAPGEQLSVSGPRVACGDLDGDRLNDLVLGGFEAPVHVARNSNLGGTPAYSTAALFLTGGLDLGDVTGDGRLDIVVSDETPGMERKLTFLINGGTPGPAWFTSVAGNDWNGANDSKQVDLGPLPR